MDPEDEALARAVLDEACIGTRELVELASGPEQRREYEEIAGLWQRARARLDAGDLQGTRELVGEARARIAVALGQALRPPS